MKQEIYWTANKAEMHSDETKIGAEMYVLFGQSMTILLILSLHHLLDVDSMHFYLVLKGFKWLRVKDLGNLFYNHVFCRNIRNDNLF